MLPKTEQLCTAVVEYVPVELTCRRGQVGLIVVWLRYKEDFQQGSVGAPPDRNCRIFLI